MLTLHNYLTLILLNLFLKISLIMKQLSIFLLAILFVAMQQLPLLAQSSAYTPYTVRSGDSFYRLASVFGISIDDLKKANPQIAGNKLNVGQVINVPAGANKVPIKTATSTADRPVVVVLHNDAMASTSAELLPMKETGIQNQEPIARAVSDIIAPKTLPKTNNPNPTLFEAPRVLSVTTNPPIQEPSPLAAPAEHIADKKTTQPATEKMVYAVVSSDAQSNTGSTARSITPAAPPALQQPATVNKTTVTAGQPPATATYTTLKPLKHKVREKETLFSLAQFYGQSVATLQNWNNLTDVNIQKGQEIIVDWLMPTGEALTALELSAALGLGAPAKPNMSKYQMEFTKFETDTLKQYVLHKHEGMAVTFDDSDEKSSTDNMYCMHRYAPTQSIVKVTNLNNKQSVYLMVIGKLPSIPEYDNVLLSVTKTAAKRLPIYNALRVKSTYYTPR